MITTTARATAQQLIAAAGEASRGIRAVAVGKPSDQPTHSDARSFLGIADLLDLLIRELAAQRALADQRGDALARIADLKVRDGAALIERGDWRRIAAELREIAGETLATQPTTPPWGSAA